ncbi:MAG: hypothetical protein ABI388_08805 [Bacteroidia bacterium]
MKLNLKLLFIGLFIASISIKANDTLKVKKVRFFVEPKATFIIPTQKHQSYNDNSANYNDVWSSFNYTDTWRNKISTNFGISAGLSVKLCKHFYYEFSASYNHYVFSRTLDRFDSITNIASESKQNIAYNFLTANNGISFKYKHLIINSSVQIGVNFQSKMNLSILENNLFLMSEHKIGYSLLKSRMEAYIGVNIMYQTAFGRDFKESRNYNVYNPTAFVMPFTSLRINF